MGIMNRLALLLVVAVGLAGCAPMNRPQPDSVPPPPVTHVVIMWLYDPGDKTAKEEVLATGRMLATLPGVVSLKSGLLVKSADREVVDNTYDIAFVVTFQSEAAMRSYLTNPLHVELKKNVLDRYVERYKVYDFAPP